MKSFRTGLVLPSKQRGKLKLAHGAAILLAAVAVAVLIELVLVPYYEGRERFAAPDMEDLVPLAELETHHLEVWRGTLSCGATGGSSPFERDVDVLVGSNLVAYERGNIQAFLASIEEGTAVPAELDARFELWRGEISDGRVQLHGWYTEGNDVVKRVAMTGNRSEGSLQMEGERGPRDCSFEATAG